jgi:hypothetical protein
MRERLERLNVVELLRPLFPSIVFIGSNYPSAFLLGSAVEEDHFWTWRYKLDAAQSSYSLAASTLLRAYFLVRQDSI